jgi:fructokinase
LIVVGGESLVDLIARTDELHAVPGGGPYNVARTVARLGQSCAYLGALSTDRFGVRLRKALREDGVDDTWAPLTDDPTTLAVAQIGEGGAATYSFYVERTSAADLSSVQALAVLAAMPTVLYVGTLGLVLEPAAGSYETLVEAAAPDVLVAVDPNCRPAVVRDPQAYRERLARVLARADVVKVSTEDLDYLCPELDHLAGAQQLADLGPSVVLLTDGGRDVTVVGQDWRRVVPVPAVSVVDTVGAGDSFLGGVLSLWEARGLGRDQLLDEQAVVAAVEFGIAVSAITCGRSGAEPPRVQELRADLQDQLSGV